MLWVSCLFAVSFTGILVEGIVSKPQPKGLENGDTKKQDNAVAQSIDRDYISAYDDHYEHGNHGLSAHSAYGYGYDGYGTYEDKHPVHHFPDQHHHHHHHAQHKPYDYHKALAIKGLLVPLAGVALLGAAAAFVSNPVLLQLGVISGTTLGRKRRSVGADETEKKFIISKEDQIRLREIKLLERFIAQVPKQEVEAQEKKMLANYLSCSGAIIGNLCLERLACELHSSERVSMPMEANVLTIVVNEILANDFIPAGTKVSILKAVERGKNNLSCEVYKCKELETSEEKENKKEEPKWSQK